MEIDHIAVFLLDTKEKLFCRQEKENPYWKAIAKHSSSVNWKNYFLRIKGRPQICLMITG